MLTPLVLLPTLSFSVCGSSRWSCLTSHRTKKACSTAHCTWSRQATALSTYLSAAGVSRAARYGGFTRFRVCLRQTQIDHVSGRSDLPRIALSGAYTESRGELLHRRTMAASAYSNRPRYTQRRTQMARHVLSRSPKTWAKKLIYLYSSYLCSSIFCLITSVCIQ